MAGKGGGSANKAEKGRKRVAEAAKASRTFSDGLAMRTTVLGEEHVGRSVASAGDDFLWPLQELVIEVGWGKVWCRPGLERKTRSLLNLAMLTALNRPHELEIHLKGALANGCSAVEIREALLQAGVYAGFPAALDAFRTARRVLDEAGVATED